MYFISVKIISSTPSLRAGVSQLSSSRRSEATVAIQDRAIHNIAIQELGNVECNDGLPRPLLWARNDEAGGT